jgi:NADH-quinone oxidoreductase subunit H
MIASLFYMLIFPGFLFLSVFGLAAEFFDRKMYARLQNRIGPPWFQPLADFIKLVSKEEIIPDEANPRVFRFMPVLAVTSAVSPLFYIPLWSQRALFFFNGDVIVVLYLLTIPTLSLFLGGWYSTSLYSRIGAVRALTQLFAYEAPLFMAILAPAILADTWCLSEMTVFYAAHPWYWLTNLLGFAIAIVSLLGKLEKVPFDIPEAETEIVAGTLTEYSGKLLGLFKLAINIETIVASSLLTAVFIPFGLGLSPALGFPVYIVKVCFIVAVLSLARTVMARLRIDQMMALCWKYIAPLAFAQIMLSLILKGVLPR